jgi:hypothetical protein
MGGSKDQLIRKGDQLVALFLLLLLMSLEYSATAGFILFLLVLQLPLFLGIELGFLTFIPFAFVFAPFVAHIGFSLF